MQNDREIACLNFSENLLKLVLDLFWVFMAKKSQNEFFKYWLGGLLMMTP